MNKIRKDFLDPRTRLELLQMPRGWTCKEIKKYFAVGQSKAYELLKMATPVKYFNGYYTIESILNMFGTNRVKEVHICLMQLGYLDKVDSYNMATILDENDVHCMEE